MESPIFFYSEVINGFNLHKPDIALFSHFPVNHNKLDFFFIFNRKKNIAFVFPDRLKDYRNQKKKKKIFSSQQFSTVRATFFIPTLGLCRWCQSRQWKKNEKKHKQEKEKRLTKNPFYRINLLAVINTDQKKAP